MLVVLLLLISIAYISAKVQGLIAAVYTPFDNNVNLNVSILNEYSKYLYDSGVVGVFVGGTTGESLSLSLKERKELADAWVKAAKPYNLSVIIHVGADSLIEARELATYSESIGANGISAMSPVFFKPTNVDVLVDCMKFVAAGAPKTNFFYYHIPPMTGVNIDVTQFFLKSVKEIPTFAGIKFSDAILNDITEIQHYINDTSIVSNPDNMAIYFGRDEQFDSALYMGVDGGVGSTYAYAARIYTELIKEYNAKNYEMSRVWQYRSQKFVRVFAKYTGGNVNSHKYLCSLSTKLDFGPPRLPYRPISDENKQAMEKELTDIGYFDWIRPSNRGIRSSTR